MSNVPKFDIVKCEDGIYIKKTFQQHGYSINFTKERFNGHDNEVGNSWKENWYLLKGETDLTSYQIMKSGERVNYRWELIDKENNEMNLPLVISIEDSCEYQYDYDYCIGEACRYYKFRFLYNRVYDNMPDYRDNAEYEIGNVVNVSVSDINNYQSMKVSLHSESRVYGNNSQLDVDLSNIVNYSDIEQMLTPPLALHNRPCELTSKQSYRLIRHYVKENINHAYAVITSDYDLCFTVQKRIPIKPYVVATETKKNSGGSYKPPRFVKREDSYKTWVLFEMTNQEDRYKGYTVIPGFKGENLSDLCDNIKTFLDELMNKINCPLVECEHCSGYGYIKSEK